MVTQNFMTEPTGDNYFSLTYEVYLSTYGANGDLTVFRESLSKFSFFHFVLQKWDQLGHNNGNLLP